MNFRLRVTALVAAFSLGSGALALADEDHEHEHFDVLVTRDTLGTADPSDDRLVTGGYRDAASDDHPANTVKHRISVFGFEVAGVGSPAWEGVGEPGFRASDQATLNTDTDFPAGQFVVLPGSHDLTFQFLPMTLGSLTRSMLYWDGTGEPATGFGEAPSGTELQLYLSMSVNASINVASMSSVPGFAIDTTSGSGAIHQHLDTYLSRTGGDVQQGFYVVSLGLDLPGSGLPSADPIYMVFAAYDAAAFAGDPDGLNEFLEGFEVLHAEAQEWVETSLVPEPSAAWLACAGFVALVARRRIA